MSIFGGDTGVDADFHEEPSKELTIDAKLVKEIISELICHYRKGGLSCSYCESVNVKSLDYLTELSEDGFMFAILCGDCGKRSEDGDGEFFQNHKVVNGQLIFVDKEEGGEKG